MRAPVEATDTAMSSSECQAPSNCSGERRSWSTKKLICMTFTGAPACSDARSAWIEQPDETLRRLELPRPIVVPQGVAPARQRTQRGLAPTRRARVLHRRKSASQHRHEVAYALP